MLQKDLYTRFYSPSNENSYVHSDIKTNELKTSELVTVVKNLHRKFQPTSTNSKMVTEISNTLSDNTTDDCIWYPIAQNKEHDTA